MVTNILTHLPDSITDIIAVKIHMSPKAIREEALKCSEHWLKQKVAFTSDKQALRFFSWWMRRFLPKSAKSKIWKRVEPLQERPKIKPRERNTKFVPPILNIRPEFREETELALKLPEQMEVDDPLNGIWIMFEQVLRQNREFELRQSRDMGNGGRTVSL